MRVCPLWRPRGRCVGFKKVGDRDSVTKVRGPSIRYSPLAAVAAPLASGRRPETQSALSACSFAQICVFHTTRGCRMHLQHVSFEFPFRRVPRTHIPCFIPGQLKSEDLRILGSAWRVARPRHGKASLLATSGVFGQYVFPEDGHFGVLRGGALENARTSRSCSGMRCWRLRLHLCWVCACA